MTRNLDHRIEVIVPLLDSDIASQLRGVLRLQLEDTVKSRIIDAKQQNEYVINTRNVLSSQHEIYKSLL